MKRTRSQDWRVVHQVASWCLSYPDDALANQLPLLRTALAEQPDSPPVAHLRAFVDHASGAIWPDLVDEYVRLFDLSRHHTLYLSYWTDGDTRRRGATLVEFKQRYRESGLACATGGELPDHLPMVLEYAAIADPAGGRDLLQEYRASVELIRLALIEQATPYADVLDAVCKTLPGPLARNRNEAMAMASRRVPAEPPSENVGLEMLGFPTVGPPAQTGAR